MEEKKSKRQERRDRAQTRARQSRFRTMGLIAAGAILIVAFFIYQQAKPVVGIIPLPATFEVPPQAEGNSMGDPNAPIQITEFSDFQCPFCKRHFNETEPLLIENFIKTGKVHFTYRSAGNWVSGNLGGVRTESADAAAAAYCAADQGKFWEMHYVLFNNNRDVEDQGSFTDKRIKAMAEAAGLDTTAFNDCYDSGEHKDAVEKDADDATDAGIQGTPFFVVTYKVDGEIRTETIDGAQPISAFQQTIENALLIADK